MIGSKTSSLDTKKKFRAALIWILISRALFVSIVFGFIGHFLVEYGFLTPPEGANPAGYIEIQASGKNRANSKGTEVWFRGAFRISDDRKIPWNLLVIDSTWEKRGDIFVANQLSSSVAKLKYEEPVCLEFISNPYSGIVIVRWAGTTQEIDLYSSKNNVKRVVIDQGLMYKSTRFHSLVVVSSFLFGLALAAASAFLGWVRLCRGIFLVLLVMSMYLTLAAFFPGVYTNDSADQLRQALTGNYQDWHPPLMAWVWSLLIKSTGEFESLLIFHLLLLLIGAIFWARALEHAQAGMAVLVIPIFLVSPVVINFSGVVWKDVGFAFSLFLSCGIVGLALLENKITSSRVIIVIGLLTYAIGVRPNGIPATFPILLLLSWLAVTKKKSKPSQPTIIAMSVTFSVLLLAALVFAVNIISYNYLKAERQYPIQYLELYDIAGISTISDRDYFPDFIKNSPGHDIDRIRKGYKISISWGNANNLIFAGSDGSDSLIPLNIEADLQNQLRTSWLKAIHEEPSAYLTHRLAVVKFLMGEGYYSSEQPQSYADRELIFNANSVDKITAKDSRYSFPGVNGAKEFVADSQALAKGSFLYIGWFWLILLLGEFLLGIVLIKSGCSGCSGCSGFLIAMVAASGLLYILPYFFIAPASDFRYLYWSAISGGISAIFIGGLAINLAYGKINKKESLEI